MYTDIVFLSGIGVVGLMLAFFGGFIYVAMNDAKHHADDDR